jgi:hypothetical protein
MFDSSKAGKIENEKVRTILNTLGLAINDLELEALLEEEDKEGNVQESQRGRPVSCIQDVYTTTGQTSSASSSHQHKGLCKSMSGNERLLGAFRKTAKNAY